MKHSLENGSEIGSTASCVVKDFLLSHPAPDAYFWSVRDISKRYGYSEYKAYSILKALTSHGYLEQKPHHRAILKKHVTMPFLGYSPESLRPVFIWPSWKHDELGNLMVEYAREAELLCQRKALPYLFLDCPETWGDSVLLLQLKAMSANVVVVVDPPPESLILFTRLRAEHIPVLAFGPPRRGYDELGVITIGGSDEEALYLLLLKLKSLGVKSPMMIGYGEAGYPQRERLTALTSAFPDLPTGSISAESRASRTPEEEIRRIGARLNAPNAPDAFIFNDSPGVERALNLFPELAEKARQKKCYIAVFDDSGACVRLEGTLPLISIRIPAKKAVDKTFDLVTSIRAGKGVLKRTLIHRSIIWPDCLTG